MQLRLFYEGAKIGFEKDPSAFRGNKAPTLFNPFFEPGRDSLGQHPARRVLRYQVTDLTGKGFEPITSNAGNESRFGTKLADSECHRIRQTLSNFITPRCQRMRKYKKWV